MAEEFEKLESVDEMLEFLGNEEQEQEPHQELVQEVLFSQANVFARCFARYQTLSESKKEMFETCIDMVNDDHSGPLDRTNALTVISQILFCEPQPERVMTRKNETESKTPCEDCEGVPTHLIQFESENRTEEHFLCEDCEKAAKAEED